MTNNNIIQEYDTITEVIKKLGDKKVEPKVLFVCNKKSQLIGSITDGDIRRGWLKSGKKIMHFKARQIMKKKTKFFFSGKIDFSSLNEKEINDLKAIPVLNKNKTIEKILNLQKNFINKNIAFIMAGGKGLRLYPITKNIPKPLIKIHNKSNLDILIKNLIQQNFININISVNYKANQIIKSLLWCNKIININFLKERKMLGTAGSLSFLKKDKIKDPILVVNADIITNLNFNNIVNFHAKNKSDLTVCVKSEKYELPFAKIIQKNNRILNIKEKPSEQYISNLGIYVISPLILKFLKLNSHIDMPELIKICIQKKLRVLPFYLHENWIDYGTKDNLIKLNKKFHIYFK
jgi:dTDP-glucose pyrophosphorylase